MGHPTELDKTQTAFLFQEESVGVHPYLHTLPRKEFAEPDMRLMLGVLEDALRCLEKYLLATDGKGKALFDETEDWVFAKNDDWIFSFSNVCEVLGFNPQCIRKAVLQWKTRKPVPPKITITSKFRC